MSRAILIADDEDDAVQLLSATLNGDDRYRVLVARDGREALEVARREKPELIFLDILMPKLSGLDVCRALRSDPGTKQTRIVMLTALAQEDARSQAVSAGANGYVTKPFSPTELLDQVEEILSRPARRIDSKRGNVPALARQEHGDSGEQQKRDSSHLPAHSPSAAGNLRQGAAKGPS